MNPFELALAEAEQSFTGMHVEVMLPRMAAAAVIGGLLALRPWRLLLRKPLPPSDMIQAQILLCAAAAVITAVIGDSLAKAFGLVGLGGFVRFRSGLKDPRDAAILFLVIGLGMACGHGSLGLAFVGMGFVGVLLFALDLVGEPLTERELDVLRMLQGSLSLHEIAVELYLSANTVKSHARAVYRKLGAHSRADAVRVARERSLV